ncbi:MAG: glutaredoxin family protein [Burkholderiaceae bacterium]|nr:glutaredoxin family protein [Burkholderiaceae bacterium]
MSKLSSLAALGLAAHLLVPGLALAQYKVVAPDGRITYTDRPPTDGGSKVTPLRAQGGAESELARLPLALREPVSRYPVTLYTSNEVCLPCDSARALLRQRGIPYSEKQALSNEDKRQLEALIGALEVPALAIGAQVLRGFALESWQGYLDAAGYPRTSALPSSYQQPAATPLSGPPGQANKQAAPQPAFTPELPSDVPAQPPVRF